MNPGDELVVEHKCLAGSATIFDHNTGTYESAISLFERGVAPRVSAMDASGVIVVAQARPLVLATERPICRISTLGGRVLRVSGNHPIWTPRAWVAACDLVEGDWVATPRQMASEWRDAALTDEQVRLIGYMIGDGSFSNMSFTKGDEVVLADVIRCARAVGESSTAITRPNNKVPHIRFSKVGPVAGLMLHAGFERTDLSADKRLPFRLGLSDRQLGQIVGSLWSTDGCIDTTITTSDSPKLRIIYTSVSHGLCGDIQHALQRLGIVSNVRTTSILYLGERRPVSTVQVVSRASKRRFLALSVEGTIALTRSRVSLDSAAKAIPSSPQGNDSRMQPNLHEHLWWDRIEDVLFEPVEQTFDLEVPGPHTFIVDGIVTHNTTSHDLGLGSPFWERLKLDSQVSNYLVGARRLGYSPIGVLYDVVRKVRLQPHKATPIEKREYTQAKSKACPECKRKNGTQSAPHAFAKNIDGDFSVTGPKARDAIFCSEGRLVTDPGGRLHANMRAEDETADEYRERVRADIGANPEKYFQRGMVVRLENEENEAAEDMWAIGEQIRASQKSGRWRRNLDTCNSFGVFCSYWPVCTGTARIDDPTRYRDSKKHEELDAVVEDAVGSGELLAVSKRRLPILSTSSARAYGSCPRKYYYAYELRRRAIEDSDALRFGTLFHVGLEVWWKTVDLAAALVAMRASYTKLTIENVDAIRAEELMLGYHVRWRAERLAVLAVEAEFSGPLVNPATDRASQTWQRGGKIDAIIRVDAAADTCAA